ncbi:hypothetical protein BJX70DRAFT_363468, partial [Aspergillus crustosus]
MDIPLIVQRSRCSDVSLFLIHSRTRTATYFRTIFLPLDNFEMAIRNSSSQDTHGGIRESGQ